MVRSMKLQTLGAVATVLALGSACAQTTTSTAADGGARDATADVVAPACGLAPLVDLDREGIATPDGVAAWVDFSRASDERLVPPIATCGGEVRLPVMVRWTAPRAGYLRVRVQRDRPDPHSPGSSHPFTLRRVAGCAWDAPSLGCGLTAFQRDLGFLAEEFELPVEAGPQWLVLAWTFDFRQRGLERAAVPALRVALALAEASRLNQACSPVSTVGASYCPVGTDCDATATGTPRCIPRGSPGAGCRVMAPRCDDGLICHVEPARCLPALAPGAVCRFGGCGIGYSCQSPGSGLSSVCVRNGREGSPCRADSDPLGPCDASLSCNQRVGGLCGPAIPSGAACEQSVNCREGEMCGGGRCAQPGSEGTPCVDGAEPRCLDGLRCFRGTCTRMQPRGGACASAWCELSLDCVGGRCVERAPGRCLPFADDCPAGQMCQSGTCRRAYGIGDQPGAGECLNGLRVDEGRCAVAAPSTPCLGDEECLRGTVCRDRLCVVEGQCPPPSVPLPEGHVPGVVCGTNSRCVATSAGTAACRPVGREGGLCRSDSAPACDEGHRCVGGVCVAASSKSGGVCADHLACPPGTRCDLGCVPAVGAGQEGGRCRRSAEGRGECDGGLGCDLATLTCSR